MIKTLDDVHVVANWIEVRIKSAAYRHNIQGDAKNKEYRAREVLHLLMYRLTDDARECVAMMAHEMDTAEDWHVVTDYIIALSGQYTKHRKNLDFAKQCLRDWAK